MGLCDHKKGKSIGQIHPSEVCFQSNIGSFLRTDIYIFGDSAGFASKFITPIYGIGLKRKKRELLLAIHAFYLKI
jgi:hypothetical protein